jgi:hypothetical protein
LVSVLQFYSLSKIARGSQAQLGEDLCSEPFVNGRVCVGQRLLWAQERPVRRNRRYGYVAVMMVVLVVVVILVELQQLSTE